MRTTTVTILILALAAPLAASASPGRSLDGTLKLGGIIRNQTGDRSAVQETYNVYDGFSVTQVRLNGMLDARNFVALDLADINLDSRKGDFVYRGPGRSRLTAGYVQHRQIFSPDGGVSSMRKDWRVGAETAPVRWLGLSGGFQSQTRDGDRLPYPPGTLSVLGTGYDNALRSGELTAEVRDKGRGAAVTYRVSQYTDRLDESTNRLGQVVSARVYAPCRFYGRLTNLLRGAYGVRRLSNRDLEYTLANVQYTGVLRPVDAVQLRYAFEGNRVDDRATRLKTDRFRNDVDATWYHAYGQVRAGYGYETNDDDRTLTSASTWRVGTDVRLRRIVDARVDWASRVKKDQEELTLLKDVDASQIRAKLELHPGNTGALGVGFTRRERDFTSIQVDLKGDVLNAFGRYGRPGWGAVSADYTHSADDCRDLTGGFHLRSHVVTGRVEVERIPNLRLASGVTYLNLRRDLDIEKTLVFVEGSYTLFDDYHLEARYNVYNYDDYVLIDRYYTANVLRIDVAYDLHLR